MSSVALGIAVLLLSPPAPALADGTASGWTDGYGVGASAESEETVPQVVRRSNGQRPACRYAGMSANEVEIADHMAQTGVGPERGDGAGTWYWKTCVDPNGNASATVAWVPQRVSPQAVARRALQYTTLVDPAIGMSPPPSRGAVVNVPLWLWVDSSQWAPTSATASVDGVTVETTARPNRVRWSLGNGDEIVCDGPGTPYDPSRLEAEQHSDCTFVYSQAGRFTVTATVEWDVSWTAVGVGGGGNLGVVRRSASVEIPVSEIQALNRLPR
jgi:hypothetical protein